MTKTRKCILALLAFVVLLPLLLAALLYCPPVQRWAVGLATDYASEATGMEISIDDVRLRFPLDLSLGGVKAIKRQTEMPHRKDTVLMADRVVCDVSVLPLLRGQVDVNIVELDGVRLNTIDFIPQACVRGSIGQIKAQSRVIDLCRDTLFVNDALIDRAKLDIALRDTTVEDTTSTHVDWCIGVGNLSVTQSDVTVHMPGDSVRIGATLGRVDVTEGKFDLGRSVYSLSHADWKSGDLSYDVRWAPRAQGIDVNHLAFSNVTVGVDSLLYSSPTFSAVIRECQMEERSGVKLSHAAAHVLLDDKHVDIPDLHLATPNSEINAQASIPFSALDSITPGDITIAADATIGKQDILLLGGKSLPQGFARSLPSLPLSVSGRVSGNMHRCSIDGVSLVVPSVIRMRASGLVSDISTPDKLSADVHLSATAYDTRSLVALAGDEMAKTLAIPYGTTADGDVRLSGGRRLSADMTVRDGSGTLSARGSADVKSMDYSVTAQAKALNLGRFVRGMQLGKFTGALSAKGSGTDLFSRKTAMTASANVSSLAYGGWNLNNVNATCSMRNGRMLADVVSHNEVVNGHILLDALMNRKVTQATIACEINNADFHALNITKAPFNLSVCAHVDVATDMRDYYRAQGFVSDLTLRDSVNVYRPDDITLDLLTRTDTTHAIVDCGDFHLNADAQGGYRKLLKSGEKILAEINHDIETRTIDVHSLRQTLPEGHVYLSTGVSNPLARAFKMAGTAFGSLHVDMTSSPVNGLNGVINADSLATNGVLLDHVDIRMKSNEHSIGYKATVENNKYNPQYVFKATAEGEMSGQEATLNVRLLDGKGVTGLQLGLLAKMVEQGIQFSVSDDNAILGYTKFRVNKDNYLLMGESNRLSARMKLSGEDGSGIQVYTDDDNIDALQDITLSLHQFRLDRLLAVLPYTPSVAGTVNGDFHAIADAQNLSVSSDVNIRDLVYEGSKMGNLGSEFVYMPLDDGSHHVDGILTKDGEEIGTVQGTYNPAGNGVSDEIDATVQLERLPLSLANGFFPEQILGLEGYGEGELKIHGSLSKPIVDGEVFLDEAALISVPYGVRMRFDNDPVRISGSRLLFENFQMYAYNDQPLVCQGVLDFSRLDHINLDMKMMARNFQLINAKENRRSTTYGKAYVNYYGTVAGELDRLRVKGKVEVLPTTDLTYVLRDSPLTTDNRLKELVTFTDFSDDGAKATVRPTVNGINVDLSINVNPGTHLKCDLNTDHSNYLDLIGGGDLRMQYSESDINMTGRYTMTTGEMKYSLPVIPLKTFTISNGSYIEFTGDMMNPRINITATEQTKASVTVNGTARLVAFDCGVVITKTLNDMGLEFTIDAPQDQSIHDDIQIKSKEERGKLAVTMLTTGMYFADGNTSAFSMNSALNTFLQQEINNIAGSALRTLDLSVGLENSTDAYGAMHTDYAFKFAKRFWNNRLAISVGGKISTGPDVSGQNKSFFDNVELQYRLSDVSNQYIRLFYDRAAYDYLEGYVGKYGVGYMWKRKLQHFKDIFRLKESQPMRPQPAPADTLKNNK